MIQNVPPGWKRAKTGAFIRTLPSDDRKVARTVSVYRSTGKKHNGKWFTVRRTSVFSKPMDTMEEAIKLGEEEV